MQSGDKLPRHQRCAAHTLNLIASSDLTKIIDKDLPLAIVEEQEKYPDTQVTMADMHLQTALGKAKSLWSKYSRSAQFASVYKAILGRASISVPGQTRWNSYYDGISKLVEVFSKETTRNEYNAKMKTHGYEEVMFSANDIDWFRLYANVCTWCLSRSPRLVYEPLLVTVPGGATPE